MDRTERRVAVSLAPAMHQALRLGAVEQGQTLSDVVNEAVELLLLEDAEDLAALDERAAEPGLPFEEAVGKPRRRGSRVPRP